jgi:hypothetical protein
MKRPSPLFKVTAIVSSALLFAGLVAYRAGAFDPLLASDVQAADPDPAGITEAGPAPADPALQAADANFMSTSKSIMFVVPPGGAKKDGSKSPTLMSGSKSVAPLLPPAAPKDGPPPAKSAAGDGP